MKYTEELVKKAYKKLKCSVYFDKTQLLLRQQIIEFENENIAQKLGVIYSAFQSDTEWEKLENKILNSISFKVFPKKLAALKDKDTGEKNDKQGKRKATFVTNYVPEETRIEKVQYFINMSVEGHVLSVLWLLSVGWRLDKALYDKSYGNRIRKLIIRELEERQDVSFSPYLFEPYFQQYESWRDSALELAQSSINKDQDIIVFTMDFERYFYSVDMDGKAFDNIMEIIEKGNAKRSDIRETGKDAYAGKLNSFVQKVIEKYSSLFGNKFKGRKILPIGFLPSNVLGNWCLHKFDEAVCNGWNPLYYGRYVDDIIIVDKIERNSELYNKMSDGKLDAEVVLKYYLAQCTRWNGFTGGSVCDNCYSLFTVDGGSGGRADNKEENTSEKDENKEVRYKLNPKYNITTDSQSDIGLQNTKVKVFYFRHGESNALLQCFRKQITYNKSEFRFLPEDEAVFDANDYSEIYDIDNKESINKLRGVDGISIDKFALSKLLGKYMRISGLINDKLETKFARDITQIYDNRVIIDNYITWEKVIEIFVINSQWKALAAFIKKVLSAVSKIKYDTDGKEAWENALKDNMKDYLYSAWVRALALVWGPDTEKHIEIFEEEFKRSATDIREDRRRYLLTRMYDKYIVPVLLDAVGNEEIKRLDDKKELCLYDFTAILNIAQEGDDYSYYPYMVTMYDLYIRKLVVSEWKKDGRSNKQWDITSVQKQYLKDNFCIEQSSVKSDIRIKYIDINRCRNIPMISVGTEKQGKMKIAIANLELQDSNFEKLMKGKPNRSYRRYQSISYIINSAISEKADMLVLPEAALPIEWLPTVARTCAKNNMAMVTGIEHIVYAGKAYNYTAVILPYEEEGYRCAVLSLHLKNHYAPHELELIQGYRLEEVCGRGYELYHWKDCWFPVYCCYELASIGDRALFTSYADMLVAVEWNKDVNYYSNILESLCRDMHCYCVQVNSSDYGDSRIIMPSKTELRDIIKTKGGNNATVLVGTIDIEKLRTFQFKEYNLQKTDRDYKPTPPRFDKEIVRSKIQGNTFEKAKTTYVKNAKFISILHKKTHKDEKNDN